MSSPRLARQELLSFVLDSCAAEAGKVPERLTWNPRRKSKGVPSEASHVNLQECQSKSQSLV